MNELKKKFTITVLIAVLFVVAFLYVGSEYLVKEVESSSAQIVSDKQKIYALSAKNSQLPESKKQYEETNKKIDGVLETVIDKDKTVTFIEEAEKTARDDKVKLKIKTTSSSEVEVAGALITGSYFNFTVGGTFDGAMLFLGEMENFKYYTDIKNVRMVFDNFDELNKNMIVLTFDVKLYQKDSQK